MQKYLEIYCLVVLYVVIILIHSCNAVEVINNGNNYLKVSLQSNNYNDKISECESRIPNSRTSTIYFYNEQNYCNSTETLYNITNHATELLLTHCATKT